MPTKVTMHPTGHVEVEHDHQSPNGMPVAMEGGGMPSPQPHAAMPPQGAVADPIAAGAKQAMDVAMASPQAPIQKPDSTRGGSESGKPKAKPAAAATNKPTPKQKTAVKGKANGKPPKKTEDDGDHEYR